MLLNRQYYIRVSLPLVIFAIGAQDRSAADRAGRKLIVIDRLLDALIEKFLSTIFHDGLATYLTDMRCGSLPGAEAFKRPAAAFLDLSGLAFLRGASFLTVTWYFRSGGRGFEFLDIHRSCSELVKVTLRARRSTRENSSDLLGRS